MSLPTSRNTTYVAGVSEVKSADLNGIQDQLIDPERFIHAAGGHGTNAAIVPGSGWLLSSGAGDWFIPLALRVGANLWRVIAHGDDTGGALTVTPYRLSTAGVRSVVPGFGISVSSGAWAGNAIANTAVVHVIQAGYFYYAHLIYNAANIEFAGVEYELV